MPLQISLISGSGFKFPASTGSELRRLIRIHFLVVCPNVLGVVATVSAALVHNDVYLLGTVSAHSSICVLNALSGTPLSATLRLRLCASLQLFATRDLQIQGVPGRTGRCDLILAASDSGHCQSIRLMSSVLYPPFRDIELTSNRTMRVYLTSQAEEPIDIYSHPAASMGSMGSRTTVIARNHEERSPCLRVRPCEHSVSRRSTSYYIDISPGNGSGGDAIWAHASSIDVPTSLHILLPGICKARAHVIARSG
ncbi:hypothetical protein C8Q77DRAFT_487849 [Trametes polyzona]|nr:hypothetical protein C8Q77DRAFT_487849 [Trametes polyzona]